METSSPSSPKPPRSLDARKFVLVFLVLIVSLGALGWQVLEYRRSQALMNREDAPAPPIQWRKATATEVKAVVASITAQLDAFKRDDYQTATKYQSARLRRNFASTNDFRAMIQNGYPQFAHYKSAKFSPVQADETGKLAKVSVNLIGSDGKAASADYQMILEDGLWRVSGVSGGHATPPRAPQSKGQVTA